MDLRLHLRPRPRLPTRPRLALAALSSLAGLAVGCDDFATPAQLSAPTVVGVLAEPPVVRPGSSTLLTPLIASPDGPLPPMAATWELTETLPGFPPFGEIMGHPDGTATSLAPDEVPELPPNALPIDSVQLTLPLGGRSASVLKAVLVADATTANPTISALTVDGVAAAEGAPIELTAGTAVSLEVVTSPAVSDRATYAWYASIGEIEAYQSSPCSYVAQEPGNGWLFAVVRDGQLGIAWRAVQVTVR